MMRDMEFILDRRLAEMTHPVHALGLSDVRLMDDARYPWLVLVPRVAGAVEVLDLDEADQARLWDEIRHVARALSGYCAPDKLNIAALGNQVAQLHVHVIARFRDDDAWPRPVWGVHPARPYAADERARTISALVAALEAD